MLAEDRDFLYQMTEADRWIYERVLPAEHPLLDALEAIDWAGFEAELRRFYSKDQGQPAYPPLIMFKIELLQYLYHLTDRGVILRCSTDLLFRYFLQVGVMTKLPHPSSLTYFRQRIGEEGFVKLFDRLVAQARAAGLIRDRLRLKDASHIIANIAVPTTLGLLAELREKMLGAVAEIDPRAAEGFRIDLLRVRQSDEGADQETILQSRMNFVLNLLGWIEEQPDRSGPEAEEPRWRKLQAAADLARKILGDLAHPEKGDRTLSVVDPDARCGKHGEYFDGYLVDVMMDADSELVTALEVLPANADEAADAVALVKHEHQTHGNHIDQLSLDGIGFNGEVLRKLEDPEEGLQVEVITPPREFNAGPRYPSSEFQLTEDKTQVTCPAGAISGQASRHADKANHTHYEFPKKTCASCSLQPQCHPTMKANSRRGRRVSKNQYEAEYERARAKVQTANYHAVRKRHPAIERKLNELLRHHQARRARYWGRAKVKIQQLMTGLAVNLKRIVRLLGARQAEQAC